MFGDGRMQRQSADGMHEEGLAEGRALAGPPLQKDWRLHVDEWKRYELREATGQPLLVAESEGGGGPSFAALLRIRT